MKYYKVKWVGVGAPIYYKEYWQIIQLMLRGWKIETESVVNYEEEGTR